MIGSNNLTVAAGFCNTLFHPRFCDGDDKQTYQPNPLIERQRCTRRHERNVESIRTIDFASRLAEDKSVPNSEDASNSD